MSSLKLNRANTILSWYGFHVKYVRRNISWPRTRTCLCCIKYRGLHKYEFGSTDNKSWSTAFLMACLLLLAKKIVTRWHHHRSLNIMKKIGLNRRTIQNDRLLDGIVPKEKMDTGIIQKDLLARVPKKLTTLLIESGLWHALTH